MKNQNTEKNVEENGLTNMSLSDMVKFVGGGALSDLLVDCYIYCRYKGVCDLDEASRIRHDGNW
jgi:hypothetical protein